MIQPNQLPKLCRKLRHNSQNTVDDLDREHREMEAASSRRETSSPLEGDSSRCGPEHGLRGRGSGHPDASRNPRPARSSCIDFETSQRSLTGSFLTRNKSSSSFTHLPPARHAGNGLGRGYFFDPQASSRHPFSIWSRSVPQLPNRSFAKSFHPLTSATLQANLSQSSLRVASAKGRGAVAERRGPCFFP